MRMRRLKIVGLVIAGTIPLCAGEIAIEGESFRIDGHPTYEGRVYQGQRVEGLLFNLRAVNATFDDQNYPKRKVYETDGGPVSFVYPDTGIWDPQRNLREFCDVLPVWRKHGLLAVTLNFQGGSPGIAPAPGATDQPVVNSAYKPDGSLDPEAAARMRKAIEALDRNGMVAIVGLLYFGQDGRLKDEEAVRSAARNAVEFLFDTGRRNILIEIANACDSPSYDHAIIRPDRVCELIRAVRGIERDGRRFLVSTSFRSGELPTNDVVEASDFVLLHGVGALGRGHKDLVAEVRALPSFRARPRPIVFNESSSDVGELETAVRCYASWGFSDAGRNNYNDGFQCPPIRWSLNTPAERAFLLRLLEITGGK
ncbi:MAG: hypothetical protein JXP34_13090 [Planctomycetes bacterium]|nr:hypothetical protein [Planctomycetota bacterium]